MRASVLILFGVAAALSSSGSADAAKIRQLYVFSCNSNDCPNGKSPAALLQSADGNFYGVTTYGGAGNAGTVFRYTPAGYLTTLYAFPTDGCKHPDGSFPTALVEGADGALYGTTISGGNEDAGVIFRLDKTGNFAVLHSVCVSCGEGSDAEFLVQGRDGNFYGG